MPVKCGTCGATVLAPRLAPAADPSEIERMVGRLTAPLRGAAWGIEGLTREAAAMLTALAAERDAAAARADSLYEGWRNRAEKAEATIAERDATIARLERVRDAADAMREYLRQYPPDRLGHEIARYDAARGSQP
jgi:hypothetical protein